MISSMYYESPIGLLKVESDSVSILGIHFENAVDKKKKNDTDSSILLSACKWLDAYFAGGKPLPQKLSFRAEGTPFQQCIWKLLLKIPYGCTVSYSEIARQAAVCLKKDRMSAQAVGHAVGENPIAIVIPCHRVIGADGNLRGYAGGLDRKIWLLNHEDIDSSHFYLPE